MNKISERGAELSVRHHALRAITEALIESGYRSLDAQARALGISRSTAWTVIKHKHKLGRLQLNTTMKILANPALPVQVRAAVEAYIGSVNLGSLARRAKAPRTDRCHRPSPDGARGIDGMPASKSVGPDQAPI